jgi:hypothetical protein
MFRVGCRFQTHLSMWGDELLEYVLPLEQPSFINLLTMINLLNRFYVHEMFDHFRLAQ